MWLTIIWHFVNRQSSVEEIGMRKIIRDEKLFTHVNLEQLTLFGQSSEKNSLAINPESPAISQNITNRRYIKVNIDPTFLMILSEYVYSMLPICSPSHETPIFFIPCLPMSAVKVKPWHKGPLDRQGYPIEVNKMNKPVRRPTNSSEN